MSKTTTQDFEIFRDSVRFWQERLGLKDWDIQTRHVELDRVLANTNTNNTGAVATIALNKSWNGTDPVTGERLRGVALHEVIHVLLADLYFIAECRYVHEDEIVLAEHKIVRRLEQALG